LYCYKILKKYFYLLLISLFICSCANLEFAYKTNNSSLKIKNSTYLFIEGNESNEIYSYITSKLGASRNIDYQYKLLIKSKKNELAEVIEKDATASKFSIEYIILYSFVNAKLGCKIFDKEISTKGYYDSKSEGYSFGSDFSKNDLSKKLIYKNIDQFIELIYAKSNLEKCKNEN